MVTVKILKRRDASSIVVAVFVALILVQMVQAVTSPLASQLSGLGEGQTFSFASDGGWEGQYLYPVVWATLQIIALEILCWLYVLAGTGVKKKR